jgi:hypothetical protein
MTEPAEASAPAPVTHRLQDAIRDVRNAAADRDDVVVELRETQRTRLEMLADALQPVFLEVPAEVDWFDFVISSGNPPRLWIDGVSHVAMGRDRRSYRFLRDTRLGRTVLAESPDIRLVADKVTRYIAERLVERERLIEGDTQPLLARAAESEAGQPVHEAANSDRPVAGAAPDRGSAAAPLFYMAMGALVGAVLVLLLAWDRLPELANLFG